MQNAVRTTKTARRSHDAGFVCGAGTVDGADGGCSNARKLLRGTRGWLNQRLRPQPQGQL